MCILGYVVLRINILKVSILRHLKVSTFQSLKIPIVRSETNFCFGNGERLTSIGTAYIFFISIQISEETPELLSRTSPDIRDVLIAFFGGLALIIAKTKKENISSAIFGVAIATALMPPLCTVGYYLAEGELLKAWGAILLFLINTLYIICLLYTSDAADE